MKIVFYGKIQAKKLKLDNDDYYRFQLSKFKDERVKIEIESLGKRTLPQNRYMWGILGIISETCGHTPEELHEIFKKMFLPKEFKKWRGREIEIPGSTAKLSKGDFILYIERIRAEVAEMQISLPSPEDFWDKQII